MTGVLRGQALGALSAVAVACGGPQGGGASASGEGDETRGSASEGDEAKVPASGEDESMNDSAFGTSWRIDEGRVGPVRLSAPLPPVLAERDLEARYTARYVADAQPLEGFAFEDPPLLVAIDGGPFSAHVKEHGVVEPPVDELRADAATAARDGAEVGAIFVRASGPETEAGAGVGTTLAELSARYGELAVNAVPPTLGEDECVATTDALPGVRFLFASCEDAEGGSPITRIDITADD